MTPTLLSMLFFLTGLMFCIVMAKLFVRAVEDVCDRAISQAIKQAFKEEK